MSNLLCGMVERANTEMDVIFALIVDLNIRSGLLEIHARLKKKYRIGKDERDWIDHTDKD